MHVRAQIWGTAMLVGMAGSVAWGQPRVLIAAAPQITGLTDCRFVDVQAKLLATGMFAAVDLHDASTVGTVPTLAELQGYNVVLTYSNVGYIDNVAMGNVLADYVDAGGGVVVAAFANASAATATLRLMGRWQTDGYEVIVGGSGQTQTAATLGTVLVPDHPIMAGVATFNGGTHAYRPTGTTLTTGSTLIARWSDGKVLVAVGASPRRVDLGFWPVSSDCRSDFWVSTTDGARLMANALVFAAGTTTPGCYANCDGSSAAPILNVNDFTCFLNRYAAGDSQANCDESTTPPILNVNDFTCFLNRYAAGCP